MPRPMQQPPRTVSGRRARLRSFHPLHRLTALAVLTLALRAAPAAAADGAAPQQNPLAPDYVDIGIHGGIAWRGNVADSRYAPFGFNLGATIDVGRAPFWGGIYADVVELSG